MNAKTLDRKEINRIINAIDLEVHRANRNGGLIAWDGETGVYVAMDSDVAARVKKMHKKTFTGSVLEMMKTAIEWYDSSNGDRFIQIVDKNPDGSKDLVFKTAVGAA
jgi:short subunit dehydrogenase-like uncharacterized protein